MTYCPVCQSSDNYTPLFDATSIRSDEIFSVGECPNCHAQKILNMPDNLDRYYADTHMRKKLGRIHSALKTILLKKELNRLLKNSNNNRFIDIGGGVGDFARLIHAAGKNVIAVDGAPERPVEIEAIPDIPYFTINYNSDYALNNFTQKGRGTVILRHVLEHIRDPRKFIQTMTGYGFNEFYIVVPNHQCIQSRSFRQYYYFLDPPLHLWFYSPSTLRQLFENLNFQVSAFGYDTIPNIFSSIYRYGLVNGWKKEFCNLLRPQSVLNSLSAPIDFLMPNNVIWGYFRK